MTTTNENDIAHAVMMVAANTKTGVATFKLLYKEIPNYVALTTDDWAPSTTRNGEPMWHQIVRNIKSHYETEGNAIYEGWLQHVPKIGYRITKRGQERIGS